MCVVPSRQACLKRRASRVFHLALEAETRERCGTSGILARGAGRGHFEHLRPSIGRDSDGQIRVWSVIVRRLRFVQRFCLLVGAATITMGMAYPAAAEEPGCAVSDLESPFQNVPSGEVARITKGVLARLEACEGKISAKAEAEILQRTLFLYERNAAADVQACRQVAERGLRFAVKDVGNAARFIAEAYGRCGGDCSHTLLLAECQKGVAENEKEARHRRNADNPPDQPVVCKLALARKLLRTMDEAVFRSEAARFISKYRAACGELVPKALAALANDEAILNFHADDDAACLRALDGSPDTDTQATLYNRALCGGACTLDATKCKQAADVRARALAGRPLRAAMREKTKAFCWHCKPGESCEVDPSDKRRARGKENVSWDLKRTLRQRANTDKLETDSRILWAGDLNGDGIGDLVLLGHVIEPDLSSAALNGYSHAPTESWEIEVSLGCGFPERYAAIWHGDMTNEDDYSVERAQNGQSTVRAVCVHPEATPDCKKCASPPRACADLSDWKDVESAVAKGAGGRGERENQSE